MTRQVRSELVKLTTVRATAFLVVSTVLIETGFKSALAALGSAKGLDLQGQADLLKPTLFLPLGVALIGALSATSEFRYGYVVPTVLTEPRRLSIVVAKALVALTASALTGAVAMAASTVATEAAFRTRFDHVVSANDAARIALGSCVACALLGALGVGVGFAVVGQVETSAAITVVFLVLTPVAGVLGDNFYRWVPGGAIDALAVQHRFGAGVFGVAAGGLLLGLYVLALLAVGYTRFRLREL